MRKFILREYLKNNKIKTSQTFYKNSGNTSVFVVIPTYNEEKTIGNLLGTLEKQSYRDFEVVVVDNDSSDKTVKTVQKLQNKLNYNFHLLKEPKPGPGNARKQGMDFAVGLFYEKVRENNGILVTTDADSCPGPAWLKSISIKFAKESKELGSLAGTHIAKKEINKKVEYNLDLRNYFNLASDFILFCAQNRIGKLKMSGPNSAFLIEAYCAAGGIRQPYENGQPAPKEIWDLQKRVESCGYHVAPLYYPVVTSQRRHLYELINSGEHAQYLTHSNQNRFLTIRDEEKDLLKTALEEVPRNAWIKYQKEIMKAVIRNIIFEPLTEGVLNPYNLEPLLPEELFLKLEKLSHEGVDKNQFCDIYTEPILDSYKRKCGNPSELQGGVTAN